MNRAVELASQNSGVHIRQILGDCKKMEYVNARQAAIFGMRSEGMSLEAIAKEMGYRDHSGVHHLIDKRPIVDQELVHYVVSRMGKKRHHYNKRMLINTK